VEKNQMSREISENSWNCVKAMPSAWGDPPNADAESADQSVEIAV